MATFESDLDLRGKVKLINAILQSSTSNPTLIASKEAAIYFNSTDENIRVNVDGTNWYNTLVYKQTVSTYTALPIISANKLGYVAPLTNSTSNKFVYLDVNGQPTLKQYIDFNWLDPTIWTNSSSDIVDSGTKLPNANAVYDFVTSAISTATGSYLPLAGGTMAGNITIPTANKIIFDNVSTYISGTGLGLRLYSIGQTDFYVNGSIIYTVDETGITPQTSGVTLGSGPGTLWLASYIETMYATTITGMSGGMSGGKVTISPEDVLELSGEEGDGLTLYEKDLLPVTDVDFTLGSSSKKFSNFYSSVVTTASIVLSGATGLTSVATAITSISHPTTAIPTADAVWNLFDTIDPFNTTAGSYGTVATNTALANKDLYYLRGDNTWQSLIWDLTGTTVTLKSGIAATVFNVAATTTVAFKVRGNNYTIQSTYNGADVTLYLGEIGPSLATQRYYPIEVVSDLRTRSSILFGGTLATAAEIELEKGSDILGTPVLTVGSSLLQCHGITTNGTDVWKFGQYFNYVPPSATGRISIAINGKEYLLTAYYVEQI